MPDDIILEQKLAEMEHALRKEKAPTLYENHDIGFQMLESDDSEQRAIGVRVFRIGQDIWLYAPIFFIDGQLRGDELLFVKSQDAFVPFEEEWVNYLMAREPLLLGEQTKGKGLTPTEPNFETFVDAPDSTGSPGISAGEVKSACIRAHMTKIASKPDLRAALESANERAKLGVRQLMLGNLKVAEVLVNSVPGILELLEPKAEIQKVASDSYDKNVEVFTDLEEAKTPEQSSAIITQGYSTADRRPPSERAQLIGETDINLVEPSKTGFYTLILRDGEMDALVIVGPEAKTVMHSPRAAVIDWDKKVGERWSRIEASKLCAKNDPEARSWKSRYDDIPMRVELTPDDNYVFIGPSEGQVIGPVDVRDVTRLQNGQIHVRCGSGKDILLVKSTGKPIDSEDLLVIPRLWKAVKIERTDLAPRFKSITAAMMSEGTPMKIKEASTGYIVEFGGQRDHVMDRPRAMKLLIEKHALDEASARRVLADIVTRKIGTFFIKAAQPQGMGIMPGMAPQAPMGGMGGQSDPIAQDAARLAGEAASRGQTEVVDTAALSSMLATSDAPQFIRKYIGDLLKATDRLGRILFVIYWNYDEFSSSFGVRDLDDMIDNLISTFKSLGKIVIDLKERISSPADLPIFE